MKTDFDAIIVGGGIAGLTCGTYLAKGGLKVLIVEKNKNVGGYCRSFYPANNLRFDSCVHSLSSCRKEGVVGQVINELDLKEFLIIREHAIPDIVNYGTKKIRFFRDINLTIEEFSKAFPSESRSIKSFFSLIYSSEKLSLPLLRQISYDDFLKEHFNHFLLRKILALPVLISSSVFTNELSAFIGCAILKEHILDGGYYPLGGVQSFPNALLKRFLSYGGQTLTGSTVEQIYLEKGKVKGVSLQDKTFITSKNIVSCCDLFKTYTKLINDKSISTRYEKILGKLTPSMSSVCIYMGTDLDMPIREDFRSTLYFTDDVNGMDKVYESFNKFENNSFLLSCPTLQEFSDTTNMRKSFLMLTNTFYKDTLFWSKNKNRFKDNLISKLNSFLPDLVSKIFFSGIATPLTLESWTFNYKGAASGWAAIPSQIAHPNIKIKSEIEGLYFAGHWLTQAHGVVSAAYTGKKASNIILRNFFK